MMVSDRRPVTATYSLSTNHPAMTTNNNQSIQTSGETEIEELTVEMYKRHRPVNTEVYRADDELRVEFATEMDDGTLDVNTFQFFKVRGEKTVVPKYEIDSKFRLVVAATLREHGYDLAL